MLQSVGVSPYVALVPTCTPPGSLMVSCGDLKTCSGLGQSGSTLPGATPQMNVRLRDWLTPKLPAFSTPNRTCRVHSGNVPQQVHKPADTAPSSTMQFAILNNFDRPEDMPLASNESDAERYHQ